MTAAQIAANVAVMTAVLIDAEIAMTADLIDAVIGIETYAVTAAVNIGQHIAGLMADMGIDRAVRLTAIAVQMDITDTADTGQIIGVALV